MLLVAAADLARAGTAPKWSDDQLIGFSDVILTGRVADITSGWDTSVNTIYTYVHVDVDEVLRGSLGSGRVIIKQMGGVAGGIGLAVAVQPTFATGEDVLLFLEARPRDGTLYTSALWQGKWTIQADGGARVAVQTGPEGVSIDRRDLRAMSAAVHAAASAGRRTSFVQATPADARGAEPFVLIGNPP
ncbi:MAG: hypothetical protein ACRD1H_10275, partial [Vicinamibacterales bacterium]